MLQTIEKSIPRKTHQVLMIREGQVKQKKKRKNSNGKPQVGKGNGKKAPQYLPPKKKEKVDKDETCFECGVVGHWKRNCPKCPIELRNKAEDGTLGIFISMIELRWFTFSSNTWVFATGCGTHICNLLQRFRKSRQLKKDEMVVHVGNGARVAVQALGYFDLCIPFGVYLTLNNVYFITSINKNIISLSCLRKSGYDSKFVDDNIHCFFNLIFYF